RSAALSIFLQPLGGALPSRPPFDGRTRISVHYLGEAPRTGVTDYRMPRAFSEARRKSRRLDRWTPRRSRAMTSRDQQTTAIVILRRACSEVTHEIRRTSIPRWTLLASRDPPSRCDD